MIGLGRRLDLNRKEKKQHIAWYFYLRQEAPAGAEYSNPAAGGSTYAGTHLAGSSQTALAIY